MTCSEKKIVAKSYQGADFYFCFTTMDGIPCVVITLKTLWDQHERWDDQSRARKLLPSYIFAELQESLFEYTGPRSLARGWLIQAGFIENLDVVLGED